MSVKLTKTFFDVHTVKMTMTMKRMMRVMVLVTVPMTLTDDL